MLEGNNIKSVSYRYEDDQQKETSQEDTKEM